jgi:hypothetical protein
MPERGFKINQKFLESEELGTSGRMIQHKNPMNGHTTGFLPLEHCPDHLGLLHCATVILASAITGRSR